MKHASLAQVTVTTGFAATLGVLAQPATADTIRLSQNFDDITEFDASVTTTGFRGSPATTAGEWNFYNQTATGTPRIVNDGSDPDAAFTGPVYSGTQSTAIVRISSNFGGRVNTGVTAGEDYELSFRVYRGANSSFVFNATAFSGAVSSFEGSGFVISDGTVRIRTSDDTAYVDSGLAIAEEVWTLVRLIVDRDTSLFTISVAPEGGVETFADAPSSFVRSVAVGQVNFNAQAPTGNISYFDDVLLIEGERVIPEPATLGLMGAAGLLLLRRRA